MLWVLNNVSQWGNKQTGAHFSCFQPIFSSCPIFVQLYVHNFSTNLHYFSSGSSASSQNVPLVCVQLRPQFLVALLHLICVNAEHRQKARYALSGTVPVNQPSAAKLFFMQELNENVTLYLTVNSLVSAVQPNFVILIHAHPVQMTQTLPVVLWSLQFVIKQIQHT